MERRQFLAAAAGLAGVLAGPGSAIAQDSRAGPRRAGTEGARVVVVGGGFAGAACARALRRSAAPPRVTLVEAEPMYEACPLSSQVLVGLRDAARQRFDWRALQADGVELVVAEARDIEAQARAVILADGRRLEAERLVVAPGIELRLDALPGYDLAATQRMPHAWQGGVQVRLLRAQLEAMADGGLVVIAVPPGPIRCPPAPYERAGLVADWLARHRPRAQLVVLDAKDAFPHQERFLQAWREAHGERVRWIPIGEGGRVTGVDAATLTVETDFDQYRAAVANVIPPQRAGPLAQRAGLADRSGWCPVDPVSFESIRVPGVHVVGDAANGGPMPKAALSAVAQGRACARAVLDLLSGNVPQPVTISNACTALLGPDRGLVLSAAFRPRGSEWQEVAGSADVQPLPIATDGGGAAQRAAREFDTMADAVFR